VSLLLKHIELLNTAAHLFYSRIARIDDGVCYIGMKKVAMIPLIGFEVLVNVCGAF
jgi:hypothetical protein